MVFCWLMGGSRPSRPASRARLEPRRAGENTVEGNLASVVTLGLSGDSHVSSGLQEQEEAAWPLIAKPWEVI